MTPLIATSVEVALLIYYKNENNVLSGSKNIFISLPNHEVVGGEK